MNKRLAEFARKDLKKNLQKCSLEQQDLFKRMYGKVDQSIETVVDQMKDNQLDWAMTQVDNTLKNKNG